MIDKENITFKIFEYHEGLLNSMEQQAVLDFIKDNPSYQIDFDAMGMAYLPEEEFVYEHADSLLKDSGTKGRGFLGWSLGGATLLLSLFSWAWYHNQQTQLRPEVLALQEVTQDSAVGLNNTIGFTEKENVLNVEKQDVMDLSMGKYNAVDLINTVPTSSILSTNNSESSFVRGVSGSLTNTSVFTNQGVTSGEKAVHDDAIVNPLGGTMGFIHATIEKVQKIVFPSKNINQLALSNFNLQPKGAKIKHGAKLRDDRVKFTGDKDPFYANQEGTYLSLNPSFAGNHDGLRLEYFYRTEWPQINRGNYVAQIITMDTYVKALRGGVGFMYEDDVIGHNKFKSRSISVFYSPKINITKDLRLEPSVKFTHVDRSIQWSQLNTNKLTDPRTGFTHADLLFANEQLSSSAVSYNILGAGVLINHSKFYLGGSYDRLNPVSYNFNELSNEVILPASIALHAGTEIKSHDAAIWSYAPSINYIKLGEWERLWLMNQLKIRKFLIGGGVSPQQAYIFNAGYTDRVIRIVYSYGLTQPPIANDRYYGSHQLALRINFMPAK